MKIQFELHNDGEVVGSFPSGKCDRITINLPNGCIADLAIASDGAISVKAVVGTSVGVVAMAEKEGRVYVD